MFNIGTAKGCSMADQIQMQKDEYLDFRKDREAKGLATPSFVNWKKNQMKINQAKNMKL